MIVGILKIKLHLPWAHSLKERRAAINSLIARLSAHFKVSVAEVENEDVHQIASIGIAFTCSERGYALRMMEQLECFVEDETDAMVLQKETELLDF
jgi:uncharacterized protein YlxP (DUF503 family)